MVSNLQQNEKIRGFEFISDFELSAVLPQRSTALSSGYDFISPGDYVLPPGEVIVIPTGVKAYMQEREFLMICIRSSLAFKHQLRLINQVGIIDADYYNNPNNEGHILIGLINDGKEPYLLRQGNAFAQGIFLPYLCTDGDNIMARRLGGIGSTDKK